jgi:hypothetical protein
MGRSLQKVGDYPAPHSRLSQALRVCRLRFTVQQCSGAGDPEPKYSGPIPEEVDPQVSQPSASPPSFIGSRTAGSSMFPSINATPDFAHGPGPRVRGHFCSGVAL